MGFAIVGAIAAVAGAGASANAASHAASAQRTAAAEWASKSEAQVRQAQNAYAQYSPAQQATINQAIASQEQNVSRMQRLVDSIDPSLIDAGKQMQDLLNGKSAPVLKNLQDQRLRQRNEMLDNLRQQIGPGAETSSMGQNMMMKFDSETANILNGAQQQYLDKVSNIALNGGGSLTDTMSKANAELASLGNQLGDIGLNQSNILLGGINATSQANRALYDSAGASSVGQQILGQGLSQAGSGLITAGILSNRPNNNQLGANVIPGDAGMTVGTNSGISETGVMPKTSALGTYGGATNSIAGPYINSYAGSSGGYQPQPASYNGGNFLGNSVQQPLTGSGYGQ